MSFNEKQRSITMLLHQRTFVGNVIASANRVALSNTRTDLCTVGIKQVRALLHHACPIFEESKKVAQVTFGQVTVPCDYATVSKILLQLGQDSFK